ncbi:two-component system sensor histidine kinase NtrB [Rhodoferax sp.]|jgi:two-component system sensor histidine kinase DctS|uniref:two-component system sensor histidine kinase NtrB n=1 Tax=Rhodoferax sp. TaxID=50421 RepID=UPI00272F1746|nr:PAS domain-containing sensor histidine kinase [Rhodoferax sp.]MDP1531344.1 PAS domain-containing sensor histidine kinase [Rhodoferax sp.]MDP1944807.1 PAS domain-containing sensor histidine kinase [Rhodoferax sp.]MDP2443669.1 PAS domain-containing sensor histidine kinase [Rhodoferax sp.]MDP3866163.1 PAS domain-containing sensor histidine kinase [Rhodoferax sp.]MDZ4208407.1 PAS domain-containing sensor histidine kinase [Rhodoferax sp.]
MTPSPVTVADASFDFALLQQSAARTGSRNRRALWWLLGLLALLLGSVVTLLLYLNNFEAEEAARRRAADAQWLEQSVQFHFRRLEDDLLVLSRQAVQQSTGVGALLPEQSPELKAGLLWREPGVILSSGWIPAGQLDDPRVGPARWSVDWDAHADNAEALALMQSTSQGLRRAAYAGLMRDSKGIPNDVVWLAVPFFDRGQFAGNYLVAVSLNQALRALLPAWFMQDHRVELLTTEAIETPEMDYRAALNLPGTDLFVQVALTQVQPTTVPRIFFLVALLFLSGMLVSLYALRRDFIKRQQVQALLQAQVALRTAMENSVTIGLRAWDLGGKILYVNDAFCRMVGYSAVELIGRTIPFPYWPVEQIDALQRVHDGIMLQGTSGEGVEVQFQHADGHLIDVLIHEAPLNTATGEQIGWMSSVLDISERKRGQRMAAQQQEKLEASGRLVAVGEVASTLAHELNQPLGALSSFANGLLNRLNDGSIELPELLPVVQRMARLAERAGGIIQRVNAFARRRELSPQRLDLVKLLQRVMGLFGDDNAPIPAWSLPDQRVWVEVDELLFEHLVNNLVGNAQDWAPHGDQRPQVWVELRVDPDQGMAVLSVADTGPGVSDDAQATIFNAFVSSKEGGMGMGLAICRSIVEAHHGRIVVSRDPLLGGACFTVTLPLAKPRQSKELP